MKYIKYIAIFTVLNLLICYLLRIKLPLYMSVAAAYIISLPIIWYYIKLILKIKLRAKSLILHAGATFVEMLVILIATLGINLYLTDYALGLADFKISMISNIKTISHLVALITIGSLFYSLYQLIHIKFGKKL